MAFDGLTIKALVNELNAEIGGGYIRKITQPEKEEIILTIKANDGQKRLFISANASLPLIYLTDINKPAPMTAPNFCMLLRKHISGGQISAIEQIGNERCIRITISHKTELKDDSTKRIYVEIMGKHSNIIFCDEKDMILDGIKHVSFNTSSVREILPGREYFIPPQEGKINPYDENEDNFCEYMANAHKKLNNALIARYVGISKTTANEVAERAGLDGDYNTDAYTSEDRAKMFRTFRELLEALNEPSTGYIVYDDKKKSPVEFAPYELTIYSNYRSEATNGISDMLYTFYDAKNRYTNIHQKSSDLRKLVSNFLERAQKKYNLQKKQMDDTKKADKFRVYGTLLQTYPYEVEPGMKEVVLNNYETGEDIKIPLDETMDAIGNSKKYFDKYTKLRRTSEALGSQLKETSDSIEHLASIQNSLLIAESSVDLEDIRRELVESGYLKHKSSGKKKRSEKSKPLHFVTKDDFHIYVGKNNFQNDELTFKIANGSDMWFHAKQIPGSHVILKTEDREIPDDVYLDCARLAGYYSSGKESEKLEIDYVEKKQIKKPAGTPPGFVVYYTNYSMTIHPTFPEGLTAIEQ